MTNAIVQDRRQVRAAGIVERHEVTPVDDVIGWWHVLDTVTGSGKQYITSATSCSCPDHTFRGMRCKHIAAVQAEAQRLTAYAVQWNHDAAMMQQTVHPSCPACGAELACVDYYVGGRGYLAFVVCPDDGSHYSKQA